MQSAHLNEIIDQRQLHVLFQPVVRLQSIEIIGFEGFIRGPSDSPLHAPLKLFKHARDHNLSVKTERLCRRVVVERFVELGLAGDLFLNVSPECLLQHDADQAQDETLDHLRDVGMDPKRVIIEMTECQPDYDCEQLREAVAHYRNLGFQIAIDDLGAGFSSFRLWSELQPDFVKIDRHFIQGIDRDPVKQQFVRSIQQIAEKSNSQLIAEGVEDQIELLTLRQLGVGLSQGYFIARPLDRPATTISAQAIEALLRDGASYANQDRPLGKSAATAIKLLRAAPAIAPDTINNRVYEMFIQDPDLLEIVVVDAGLPVGLITRTRLIGAFARLYQREVYGKRPCTAFMDAEPLIVDQGTSLQTLSRIIVDSDRRHLFNGFIVTDKGKYLGIGTGHDLMREMTQMQISAARYANPLTLLPGNVPINEHIETYLDNGRCFHVCYADLDHFKPYNDVYGYSKGDDVIQMVGRIIGRYADPAREFVGHIGGDDFIILFQNDDWEMRCQAMLNAFAAAIPDFYNREDRERGGYLCEDRRGQTVFHPLITMSLGVIRVEPGQYASHHQVAAAAAGAKKQAKKMMGNSLFVDRRQA